MKIFILLLFSLNLYASTGIPSGGGTAIINNTINIDGRNINLGNPQVKQLNVTLVTVETTTFKHYVNSTLVTYQVPSATKAIVLGFKPSGHTVARSVGTISYGDTAVEAGGNPAGTVHCGNKTTNGNDWVSAGEQFPSYWSTCGLVAPTGKFFHSRQTTGSSSSVTLYIGECPETGSCEFHN